MNQERPRHQEWFIHILFAVILYFCAYTTALAGCDFILHNQTTSDVMALGGWRNLIAVFRQHCYPGYHLAQSLVAKAIPMHYAGAVISGICYVLMYEITARYFQKKYPANRVFALAAAFILHIAGSFFLPWESEKDIIIGIDSVNVWHNPTHIFLKPFAILAFILISEKISDIQDAGWKEQIGWRFGIGISLLLVITTLAKPSFVQILYPAFVIWFIMLLIRSRGKAFRTGAELAACCIPALIVVILQFQMSFYQQEGSGGAYISFLEYWRSTTNSIPMAILFANAFPLFMLIVSLVKRRAKDMDLLGWFCYLAGMAEKALLIEAGERKYHGNFTWGYSLGLYFIWFAGIREYHEMFFGESSEAAKPKAWVFSISTSLLLLHTAAGIYHIYRMAVLGDMF